VGGEATQRAFLHIGLPKTGTTYLQHILWSNKAGLAEVGLLLPGRHRRRHLLASLDVRDDPKLARRAGDVRAPWDDLVVECQQWPGNVVISHEFFAAAATEQVARMVEDLRGYEVHVIITARPMTELGLSRWQEWIKSGGLVSVDDYPQPDSWDAIDEWGWASFDLDSVLARWGAVLPHERIHVLPMNRMRNARDLWLTFARVLGVDGHAFDAPPAPVNTSLGLVSIELLRRVNRHLTDFTSAADRGNWIRGYLAEGTVLPRGKERFRAGAAKEQELVERGRLALARLRGGRYDVCGDLGPLEPTPARNARHPSDVRDDEMLAVSVQTIANMLRDVRRLTLERDEASAAAERLEKELHRLRGSWTPPRVGQSYRGLVRRGRRALGSLGRPAAATSPPGDEVAADEGDVT
jgi:hypothetical protein